MLGSYCVSPTYLFVLYHPFQHCCYYLSLQPNLLFELSFLPALHLSRSSSTLLSKLFLQNADVTMLLSLLKPSRGSAFSSSKGYFLNLAYKFSQYPFSSPTKPLAHSRTCRQDPTSGPFFRLFSLHAVSSSTSLCLCPFTLSGHLEGICATLEAQLNLPHFLRSFYTWNTFLPS